MNESTLLNRLNHFVERAREMGYEVRQEVLDGQGAAICQIKGKPCLFLDLSSGPAEQLEAIKQTFAAISPESSSVESPLQNQLL